MFSSLAAVSATAVCAAPWGPGFPGFGPGFGFGWLFLLIPLFWIGLFILIFSLVGRRFRRMSAVRGGYGPGYGPHGWGGRSSRSAEQTLAERFAQGDIDEVEYRARLEVLRANHDDSV